MTSNENRRVNLKLVLGLVGAMIGCGAVAAATRPAWAPALLGRSAPVTLASVQAPAPTSARTARNAEPAEPHRVARRPRPATPAQVATPLPTAPVAPRSSAPSVRVPNPPTGEFIASVTPVDIDPLEREDLECDLFQRMMMGDEDASEQLLALSCGVQQPRQVEGQVTWLMGNALIISLQRGIEVLDGQPMLDSSAAGQQQIQFTQADHLLQASVDIVADDENGDSTDQVFELVIDGTPAAGQGQATLQLRGALTPQAPPRP